MSRSERSTYFEHLVALKLRPAGEDDRRSVISIEDAIVYAEAVMLATELELEAAANEDAAALAAAAHAAASEPAGLAAPAEATGRRAPRRPRNRRILDDWFGPSRGAGPELGRGDRP